MSQRKIQTLTQQKNIGTDKLFFIELTISTAIFHRNIVSEGSCLKIAQNLISTGQYFQ